MSDYDAVPDPMVPGSVLATAPADDPVVQQKYALRAQVRERRTARLEAERHALAADIAAQLRALVEARGARSIAAFLSTPLEPQIDPFLEWARAAGITVLLPLTREDGLLDWVVDRGERTYNELLRIPEPVGVPEAPIVFDEVELVICPAALVDARGGRLGWGGGYYDRMLGSSAQHPPVYALVYDDEVVDEVPRDAHDIPVDGVVTPSGRREFTRR